MELKYGILLSQQFVDSFKKLLNSHDLTILEGTQVYKLSRVLESEQGFVQSEVDKHKEKFSDPDVAKQLNEFLNSKFFAQPDLPRSILKDSLGLSPLEIGELEPLFEPEAKKLEVVQ